MKKASLYQILVLVGVALLPTACHNDPPVVGPPVQQHNDFKENMINANRTIAQSEETAIDEYVGRHQWPMNKLDNGARIWEYETGDGRQVGYEDSVHVTYSVEAVNGKTIYPEISEAYVAGRRQQMIGLDEAVMRLHFGSRAKIILPSFLAYGIGGDGDRIPQSAILILDLKVEKDN